MIWLTVVCIIYRIFMFFFKEEANKETERKKNRKRTREFLELKKKLKVFKKKTYTRDNDTHTDTHRENVWKNADIWKRNLRRRLFCVWNWR